VTTPAFDVGSAPYVSLATFRKTGAEVRTPVWIAGAGDRFFVFSAGDAGKVKRIRARRRVRLARCDVRGRVSSGWLEGEARIVTDSATTARAYAALRQKYGLRMWVADLLSKATGRYGARAVLEIRLASPAGSPRDADASVLLEPSAR